MPTTAIYARVSTDEQAEHGTSLEEQVRLCRERAVGAETLLEFVDAGITGTTLDRPQLQALLQRVRRHEIARVIVYDPDRLSRSVTHLLLVVDELRHHGVEVDFVNFHADLSPDGRLLFTVRGAISEFEAYRIKQRMYSGKQARARANQVASGTCIYGYRLDRASKRWEEEPREAQVVRLIFEWASEAGTWEIAKRLNGQGVPARFGRRWSQSSVMGIVRNPTYLGSMPQMGGLGQVPVPPLIGRPAFDRVQAALRARLNRPLGHALHPYLLSGRLTCGVCGRSMCGGYGRPIKGGATTYYGCTAKARPAASGQRCPNRFWRSDQLDPQVWAQVTAWLRDPDAQRAAAEAEAPDSQLQAELERQEAALVAAADRLRLERERLVRAFRRALIDEAELAQQQQELDGEVRVLQQRAASVQGQRRAAELHADDRFRAQEAVARIVADAPALEPVAVRRGVLGALGVRVVAGPGEEVRVRLGEGE